MGRLGKLAVTHKYSLATIAKANPPGKMITPTVITARVPAKCSFRKTASHPSSVILTTASVTAMSGASQKMVANGLLRPIDFLCITCSVRAHRRPARPDAEKTIMMPGTETEVVLKTMRKTPNEMSEMTEMSRKEYFSRWKRKAKKRTKIRVEDLHMAAAMVNPARGLRSIGSCSLYRLRVMVLRLRLDSPISPPVDTAVGMIFDLNAWLAYHECVRVERLTHMPAE